MLHRPRMIWAILLVIVLLLSSASAALAQGGGGDKYVFGSTYVLPAGETLNGNLYVAGGTATLERNSTVNGNVSVAGGSVVIGGSVHGDVNVVGGSVGLDSTAVVDGNLNRIGGSIREASGAVVRGTRQRGNAPRFNPPQMLPQRPSVSRLPESPFSGVVQAILRFFGALGMGVLLALIAAVVLLVVPGPTGQVATTLAHEPALSFTAGLLTLVLATLIGFPLLIACGLGLLVWMVALIALIFGWIAVGLWVGQRTFALLKLQTASSLAEAAAGVFLITWLAWVSPRCIGFLFGLAVGAIGVGAVLLTRFGTQSSSGLAGIGVASGPGGSRGPSPYTVPDRGQSAFGGHQAAEDIDPGTQAAPESAIVGGPGETSLAPVDAGTSMPAGEAESPGVARTSQQTTAGDEMIVPAASQTTAEPPQTRTLSDVGVPGGGETATNRTVSVALEDLEAVNGITSEIAARLRAAGSTTLIALAASDPATLARQAGVTGEQVEQQDWIGQARRLLG